MFHCIIRTKMAYHLKINERPKAFMPLDGIAHNTFTLRANMKHAQTKPLRMAYIDIKKAFDSVLHNMIILAAERL